MVRIRPFRASDEAAVIELWRRCELVRPVNDRHKDIARKLADRVGWFLVAEAEGKIVGSAMVGYDGHRGCVNYLAADPKMRRRGIRRALRGVRCAKINLQVRTGTGEAMKFYQAIGFAVDDVVSVGRRLEVD